MDKYASAERLAKKLLKENELCVLATASLDGKPEAATIEYTEDDEYNLYFESFPTNRKYKNILSNPRGSIVITQVPHTIQMDGTIEELHGEEKEHAKQLCLKKQGPGLGFYEHPSIKFFRFTPTWIRILVDAKMPPEYVVIRGERDKESPM